MAIDGGSSSSIDERRETSLSPGNHGAQGERTQHIAARGPGRGHSGDTATVSIWTPSSESLGLLQRPQFVLDSPPEHLFRLRSKCVLAFVRRGGGG